MADNGGNTIGKAYVQIVPTSKGISKNTKAILDGDMGKAGESGGKSYGEKFVAKLKKLFVAVGVGKIIKDTLTAGGELQQSIGGVETLYGDAADTIKKYADEAYKYGISANSYMEQSTSFAASLKQSLGGNSKAAAEAANTAIRDMADNSAKLGTNITDIQNAYQGFSKQNYTINTVSAA